MNVRCKRRVAGLGLMLAVGQAVAQPAAINFWDVPGSGPWGLASSWSEGHAPQTNELAVINTGATVSYFYSGSTPLLYGLYMGSGSGTSGTMDQSFGQINTDVGVFVGSSGGTGTYLMSGGELNVGSSMIVANGSGSQGYLEMTAGTINSAFGVTIGRDGPGEFLMEDGLITSGSFNVGGTFEGGTGCAFLIGGEIDTGGCGVGYADESVMLLLGTHLTCTGQMLLGNNPTGDGEVLIDSGILDAHRIIIAFAGEGIVLQNGGTVVIDELDIAIGPGVGTYHLNDGSLSIGEVTRGLGGTPAFVMSGGQLTVDVFGEPGAPFDLAPTAGVVAPDGDAMGITTVHGGFNLGPDAELDMKVENPVADQDVVVVNGPVTLSGNLSITMAGGAPDPADAFTLIDNDGADPVVGAFNGLPEGSVLTFTLDGEPYDFVLTYAGGDGNDVALVQCLADFADPAGTVDFFDVLAFLALLDAMDPSADLAPPFGVWDFFDVAAFLALVDEGCP